MSRIGNQIIKVPSGVKVEQAGQVINVTGPKGVLRVPLFEELLVDLQNDVIKIKPVEANKDEKKTMALWGLLRSLLNNSVQGVSKEFVKELQLIGVGYKAAIQGSTLVLSLGYSHDINYTIPNGIKIEVIKNTTVRVSGIDKQQVGQVASNIRSFRTPEPYKGKGVRYVDEYVRRKEGKKKKK